MEIARNADGGIFKSQRLYTEDVLERFQAISISKMATFLPNKANTPMDCRIKLSEEGASRTHCYQLIFHMTVS
eukprot:gene7539-15443_t